MADDKNMKEDERQFPFISRWPQTPDINLLKKGPLRLAVQKGEIEKGSLFYLESLGWDTSRLGDDTRVMVARTGPRADVFKLKVDDIIEGLRVGALDTAILGADSILESQLADTASPLIPVQPLMFGGCSFCIGFPLLAEPPSQWTDVVRFLETAKVATSLPLTFSYLMGREGIRISQTNIRPMKGSVEAGIKLYDAQVIADRVSSGNTMFANGLRPDFKLVEFPGAYLVTTQAFLDARGFGQGEQL